MLIKTFIQKTFIEKTFITKSVLGDTDDEGFVEVLNLPLRINLIDLIGGITELERASTASVVDYNGDILTIEIDEAGFVGTRRISEGVYSDNDGVYDIPEYKVKGVSVEETRTNLFLNSSVPVTQSITVVNGQDYTVSVQEGAADLTLSDAGAGSVTLGNDLTFTASTTNLLVTVNSGTGKVQVEQGKFSTSYIETLGIPVERINDDLVGNIKGDIFPQDFTLLFEFEPRGDGADYADEELRLFGTIDLLPFLGDLGGQAITTLDGKLIETQ